MNLEAKLEDNVDDADYIIEKAPLQKHDFYEIKIEKTIGDVTSILTETTNVLEIVIPYSRINRKGLTVYSYHDNEVITFVESDTKEANTFIVDKENGLIYIYANKFSTYSIGYTPYYKIDTALNLGSYNGSVDVVLKNKLDGKIYEFKNVTDGKVSFVNVPMGDYVMTITWVDGKQNSISMPLTLGDIIDNSEQETLNNTNNLNQNSNINEIYSFDEEIKTVTSNYDNNLIINNVDLGYCVDLVELKGKKQPILKAKLWDAKELNKRQKNKNK
jgi:hypothetical protein